MSSVPYTFAGNTGNIPLVQLDVNFANVKAHVDVATYVSANAQANITSLGNLTSLVVNGNITTHGNVNIDNSVVVTGNIIGNQSALITGAVVGETISATGNVIGSQISTTGNVLAGNVLVQGQTIVAGNVSVQGQTTASGNVLGLGTSTFIVQNTANSSAPLTGALQVYGGASIAKDLWVSGNIFAANIYGTTANVITVEDPLLYLRPSNNQTYPYNYDIGLYSAFTSGTGNTYQHTGLARDFHDNTWKLFSNVAEPAGSTLVFDGNTVYDSFKSGSITSTGNISVLGNLNISGTTTLVGVATAPTAANGVSNTQIATTEFVKYNGFPSGGIIMWSGSIATIPSGWNICDGTNGTPDLRDRFIVGAGNVYAVGTTGGSTDAILVSHTHTASTTVTDSGHRHYVSNTDTNGGTTGPTLASNNSLVYKMGGGGISESYALGGSATTPSVGLSQTVTTGITVGTTINSAGSSGTNANLPPYYALAYIMKL
jgi:cytoskeletal protein CcmA (bactofilin family)